VTKRLGLLHRWSLVSGHSCKCQLYSLVDYFRQLAHRTEKNRFLHAASHPYSSFGQMFGNGPCGTIPFGLIIVRLVK